MRVVQSWGLPGALAGGIHVIVKVAWLGEMVQLIGALRRCAEWKWVLVLGSALYAGGRRRFEFL